MKSLFTGKSGAAAFVFVCLLALPLEAQNRLYISNQDVTVGQTGVLIPIRVDTDQIRHGFSVAIKYDQTKLSISETEGVLIAGTVSAEAEWSNGQVFNADGKLHWGVVLDLGPTIEKQIPIGTNQIVLNLKADVVAAAPGTTTVTPQDGLGTPTGGWTNILSYKGDPPTKPTLVGGTITINAVPTGKRFKRANCNSDNQVDISDAVFALSYLFTGGEAPKCKEACNANSDVNVDLSDAVYILTFLFLSGPLPAAPYPACDVAPEEKCAIETCTS